MRYCRHSSQCERDEMRYCVTAANGERQMRYCIRYVVRKAGVFSRKMVFMPSSVFY
uniref:Uncharacterized protein n=2 Tax=Anguilla anguilla TaxID=7936 RepID=A0A0E9UH43_ANGAN